MAMAERETFKVRIMGKRQYCFNWSMYINIEQLYDLIKAGHNVYADDKEGNNLTQELLARIAKRAAKVKSKENLYRLIRGE